MATTKRTEAKGIEVGNIRIFEPAFFPTMADQDLEAIRRARLQELQSQSGGGKDGQKEEEQKSVRSISCILRNPTY